MTTDCDLVLSVLKDGRPHHVIEICRICKPGCINFAARSRIADLRRKGLNIVNLRSKGYSVPEDIRSQYSEDDREAVYQLVTVTGQMELAI